MESPRRPLAPNPAISCKGAAPIEVIRRSVVGLVISLSFFALLDPGLAADGSTPEATIRAIVQANADKDLHRMAALMAHDPDAVGYTIGGRKYVGWDTIARDLAKEFAAVARLEIPIRELHVWTRGPIAWFAMELDYIRYVETEEGLERTVLPLRETGILERRGDTWILVGWHESERRHAPATPVAVTEPPERVLASESDQSEASLPDLRGEWHIEEEDKSYTAFLDRRGNGSYTHQGGTFHTTRYEDRTLLGTWHQTGNDREGGFEVLISEDGTEARGVWWYTRVGSRNNIPPRLHGGTYFWSHLPPTTEGTSTQNAAK